MPESILQIAEGMAFLEKEHFVHRNLGARNILVGERNVVKIAGFGMAKVQDDPDFNFRRGERFNTDLLEFYLFVWVLFYSMLVRLCCRQTQKRVSNSVMFGMYCLSAGKVLLCVLPICELAFGDGRGDGCSYWKNCLILSSLTNIEVLKSQVLIQELLVFPFQKKKNL